MRAEATSHALARGAAIGPWRIAAALGAGGMSSVYEVVHARTGARAALKLARLDPTERPLTVASFLLEARCAIAVEHPGVPRLYEAGAQGDRPYLVMERLHGMTLGAALDTGPIARAAARAVVVELCDVLAAAHAAGVVHRDVKADNVFLLADDAPGARLCKLIDWGVAQLRGEEDPWAGLMAGTPQYAAPEQARGEAAVPASDVYALGVVLYRLFVGRLPFESDSATRLLRMHCRTQPPRPGRRARTVPPAIDALVRAMLAKRAADRPRLREVAAVIGSVDA